MGNITMVLTHNLGFPRIGKKRELKFALESYWRGESSLESLKQQAAALRKIHLLEQNKLDFTPVGDFSFYDQVLDMSFILGNLPKRSRNFTGEELDNYFRVARGQTSKSCSSCEQIHAGEMTKWFDTNYHYIVPEFDENTEFKLNATRILEQIEEARALGVNTKPVIIGPVTYLWLGKSKDQSHRLNLLERLLPVYSQLLLDIKQTGVEWIQIDEPILVTELDAQWQTALEKSYHTLKHVNINILLATYFGTLQENLQLLCNLPVAGVHIDAINAKDEVIKVIDWLPTHKILSLGIINGRNIWKTDLNVLLDWLEPIARLLKKRLWLAPSCSLLHVPVDLESEIQLDSDIKSWLAFALQKLEELEIVKTALNEGRESVVTELAKNAQAIQSRKNSTRVHNPKIKENLAKITSQLGKRTSQYPVRAEIQRNLFKLPEFPTTTIGSFPQTKAIRATRTQFKNGVIDFEQYQHIMQQEILHCVRVQEELDLDVLVHGEAERNDMVEYFGEQLDGYAFSQYGWVQSYGSRCVKPPILFGDISRPKAMTVEWIQYAQSLTSKPMKGMLTGPVTILNWSFVRDDQPRSVSCYQLALAIREEVLDLESAGVNIIQIDEAALREGLPLRQNQWNQYLDWAIECFRITANGVKDQTQIHTHMCYSEFNDIIEAIADMDADVITIETSRSDMELLDAFEDFNYPNEIGPGVYDIHSPNIPSSDSIVALMKKASEKIDAKKLWVNPDCGLKTRQWDDVIPALTNMVAAAKTLRGAV